MKDLVKMISMLNVCNKETGENMRNIIFCFLLLFIPLNLVLAGWERTYGGTYTDIAYSVIQLEEDGFIICGSKATTPSTYSDAYVIRIDTMGDTLWTRTISWSSYDHAYKIAQTFDGGYIIGGKSSLAGGSSLNMNLSKLTAFGIEEWHKNFTGLGYSALQALDHGYVIVGSNPGDVIIARTDSLGNFPWTRCYGGSSADVANSVIQTTDRGFLILGSTESYGFGNSDIYLIKTTEFGDSLWTRTYGGSENEYGNEIIATSDGAYAIVGNTTSFGSGGSDIYLLKISAMGDTIWTKTYGSIANELGYSLAQTNDGGYIIVGSSSLYAGGDVYLVKTDEDGEFMWDRRFGGGLNDGGRSVAITSDNGFIIAGFTNSFGAGSTDAYVIKTDSLGLVMAIKDESSLLRTYLLDVFPNPFNSTISITAPKGAVLEVFDIQGRIVGELPGGETIWKPEPSIGSGIYLVRATVGEQEISKRIVYLK